MKFFSENFNNVNNLIAEFMTGKLKSEFDYSYSVLIEKCKLLKKKADEGNVDMMNHYLKHVNKLCKDLDINLVDKISRISIKHDKQNEYLSKQVEDALKYASRKAKEGNLDMMNHYIRKAIELNKNVNKNLDVEIEKIKNSFSKEKENEYLYKELEDALKYARKKAEEGNSDMMNHYIRKAIELNKNVNKDLDVEIEKIKNTFSEEKENEYLSKQLEDALKYARKKAEEGNSEMMNHYIRKANNLNINMNKDLDIEIEKIRNLLL